MIRNALNQISASSPEVKAVDLIIRSVYSPKGTNKTYRDCIGRACLEIGAMSCENCVKDIIGPIPWGHSGPLCHALSWTSMRRWRATVRQWRRATV